MLLCAAAAKEDNGPATAWDKHALRFRVHIFSAHTSGNSNTEAPSDQWSLAKSLRLAYQAWTRPDRPVILAAITSLTRPSCSTWSSPTCRQSPRCMTRVTCLPAGFPQVAVEHASQARTRSMLACTSRLLAPQRDRTRHIALTGRTASTATCSAAKGAGSVRAGLSSSAVGSGAGLPDAVRHTTTRRTPVMVELLVMTALAHGLRRRVALRADRRGKCRVEDGRGARRGECG